MPSGPGLSRGRGITGPAQYHAAVGCLMKDCLAAVAVEAVYLDACRARHTCRRRCQQNFPRRLHPRLLVSAHSGLARPAPKLPMVE